MIHQQRVIFGDTDQMGVVYYANFFRYFEAARAAYVRDRGRSQKDLDAWDCGLPVTEAHCRYRRPAHYEDLLDVETAITQVRAASLRFEYRVVRAGELLADGYTVHACVDGKGRVRRLPEPLRALIAVRPGA
jgi:acyl-CoA thioester hydrolase